MRKNSRNSSRRLKMWVITVCAILCVALYILGDRILDLPSAGEMSVHFIDVGQGDAALILTEEGSVLIDTGPTDSGEEVAAYIKTRTDEIDYLILSHPHEDHIGGAKDVFDTVKVKNVIMPDKTANTVSFDRLLDSIETSDAVTHPATAGDSYSIGALTMDILSPANGDAFDDTNNISIVLKVTFGETSFLFMGDAEAEVEEELLNSGYNLDSDVLKVGHHGSSTSSTDPLIKAVSPDIAVISCGKGNSYGHPHPETINTFEEYGISVLRTDRQGSIVIKSDGVSVFHESGSVDSVFQPEIISNHSYKLTVCGFSPTVLNSISEIGIKRINIPSVPGYLNGVPDCPFNSRSGG